MKSLSGKFRHAVYGAPSRRTRRRLGILVCLWGLCLPAFSIEINNTSRYLDAKPGEWISFSTDNRRDVVSVVSVEGTGDDMIVTLQTFTEVKDLYSTSTSNTLDKLHGSYIRRTALDLDEELTSAEGVTEWNGQEMNVTIYAWTADGFTHKWFMHDDVPVSGVIRHQVFEGSDPEPIVDLPIAGYGHTPEFDLPDPASATQITEFK